MSTNPLHIQVAEALGWTDLRAKEYGQWWGVEPYGGLDIAVPVYHRSWCAIGVILERNKFCLIYTPGTPSGKIPETWIASTGGPNSVGCEGATACEAVAKLIVKLHSEGKSIE